MACRAAALRHNVMGILTEAASARIASPRFIKKNEVRLSGRRGFQGSGIQGSYFEPWPGGWWRLQDIVDYEEITTLSFLKTIAQNKKRYLSNFALFAQRQIEKGKNEPPFAYLVPLDQRDMPTAYKMLTILQMGGGEIHQAQKTFQTWWQTLFTRNHHYFREKYQTFRTGLSFKRIGDRDLCLREYACCRVTSSSSSENRDLPILGCEYG